MIFEKLMETVLREMSWKTCLVCLDDVPGKTYGDHFTRLEEVFGRFKETNLSLNLKIYQLFHGKVKYLGHVILKDGVSVDKEKMCALKD